jgi:hypothetical protein
MRHGTRCRPSVFQHTGSETTYKERAIALPSRYIGENSPTQPVCAFLDRAWARTEVPESFL